MCIFNDGPANVKSLHVIIFMIFYHSIPVNRNTSMFIKIKRVKWGAFNKWKIKSDIGKCRSCM